jgi:hypothetical protein
MVCSIGGAASRVRSAAPKQVEDLLRLYGGCQHCPQSRCGGGLHGQWSTAGKFIKSARPALWKCGADMAKLRIALWWNWKILTIEHKITLSGQWANIIHGYN